MDKSAVMIMVGELPPASAASLRKETDTTVKRGPTDMTDECKTMTSGAVGPDLVHLLLPCAGCTAAAAVP